MYENIFTYNFLTTFFFSSIFLLINIFFSIKISQNKKIKQLFFFNEFQSIIIFFLLFFFFVLIFNLTIILNYQFLTEIFFLIVIAQMIFILKNLKVLKFKLNYNFKLDEKIILFFLFILFLISILPLSDADSISIYQYLPTTIFLKGLNFIDLNQNLEFTLLSNTEILLIISPILKSDNFGSQLNLITLLFFIILNFRNHKNFSLILLSCPLIIYFISTQKLQLFFAILFLLLFILINKNLIKKKSELFILILLLTFYSSGKISYILFTIPLFLYFFYLNFKNWKIIILYSSICFFLVYAPLLFLKHEYFGNIFAPFFDNLLGKSSEIYNAFTYSIRSSEGWISNPYDYSVYLRPFISFDLAKLSSSLGLIFLLMLVNLKLNRKTKFIPLIMILLVIITGQILPRYYFESFLLLAYYYQPKELFSRLLIYCQLSAIFLISLIYIYFAYIKFDVIKDKSKYMNRFSYSFFNAQQFKLYDLDGNILDFGLDRHSVFLNDNIFSLRYLNILNQYNNKNELNLNNFIMDNSIKYLIVNNKKLIPNCLITKEIGTTLRKSAVRNFLIKTDKKKYKILEISGNKCTYKN